MAKQWGLRCRPLLLHAADLDMLLQFLTSTAHCVPKPHSCLSCLQLSKRAAFSVSFLGSALFSHQALYCFVSMLQRNKKLRAASPVCS